MPVAGEDVDHRDFFFFLFLGLAHSRRGALSARKSYVRNAVSSNGVSLGGNLNEFREDDFCNGEVQCRVENSLL
jgi:hypothetical protein